MTNESVVTHVNSTPNSNYSFQLNRWSLKILGAWPKTSSTSRLEKIISISLNVICFSSILFTAIPCGLHVFLEDNSFYIKTKVLGLLSHWTFGTINYITLLLRHNDIRYCVNYVETDWKMVMRKRDEEIMLKYAKFGRYATISGAMFLHGGMIGYCFITAYHKHIVEIENRTTVFHTLPLAAYKKLIPVDKYIVNEIVVLSQFFSAFIVNNSAIGIFSLTAVLASHACGQLGVLMFWINDFVEQAKNGEKDSPFKGIAIIVEYHLRVLNFILRIEEMMNRICFLELSRCTLAICLLGYYTIVEWEQNDLGNIPTYLLILTAICSNTFILCYISDQLTEQCLKVGEVVYMTDWYYLPQKQILDLILIINRSSVVVEITAGKLIQMSIYTFGDVVKSGVAYLNILRQIS